MGRSRGGAVEPVRREVETCLEATCPIRRRRSRCCRVSWSRRPPQLRPSRWTSSRCHAAPATPRPGPHARGLAPVIPLPRDDEEREQAKAEREKVRAERERQQARREAQRGQRAHALAERVQALENRLSTVALRVGEAVEQEQGRRPAPRPQLLPGELALPEGWWRPNSASRKPPGGRGGRRPARRGDGPARRGDARAPGTDSGTGAARSCPAGAS